MCESCNDKEESVEDILARYTHLDQSDPFVGSQFSTPKGGTLTVVGWDGISRSCGSNKKYEVYCSICSNDKELFPDNFQSTKGNLVKGQVPCGCGRSPRWTENQNKTRIQRECGLRGYIFHGWCGRYKGNRTKLDLENPSTSNKWKSTSVNDFLKGQGDPLEGRENTRQASIVEDSTHIKDFKRSGAFLDGTKFWRNTSRKDFRGNLDYWNYTCPKCSNDEYVKAGVCSGVFIANTGSLKKGNVSCRCSKNYKWSKDQTIYKVLKQCEVDGYTYHGYLGVYKGVKTLLDLENPVTGNRWRSTKIGLYLRGAKDPSLRGILEDEQRIEQFLSTNAYPRGTKFTKNTYKTDAKGTFNYWDVYCPICAKDTYSKAGIGGGIFTAPQAGLIKGNIPCRCNTKRYVWSQKEREFQINLICNEEGFSFLKWEDGFKGDTTKFIWLCDKGHINKGTVNGFVTNGTRCSTCAKQNRSSGNGYFYSRKEEQDFLYIIVSEEWIKCGRSFNPEKRLKGIQRVYGKECQILRLYTAPHQTVYDLEQKIKDTMYEEGLNFYEGDGYESVWEGSTECYQLSALDYIQELIDESELKLVEDNS